MKKNLIYLAGAFISSAILTFGCSEELPTYTELAVDKTEVFIQADGNDPTARINITSGNGNYKLTVADDGIATATMDGNQILINGLRNGTTTATVMDWAKYSAVITIRVKEDFDFLLDRTELVMFMGENELEQVSINSGNGGYEMESSDESVATAELNQDGRIAVTAHASGFCTITVTDADGLKGTISVTVCDEHLVIEDASVKPFIVDETTAIAITSGNGEYTVVSDNPSVATAEIGDGIVNVTGVAKGSATITITDRLKQTQTFTVTVTGGLKIDISRIDTVFIGSKEVEIPILDGSGDYTIDSGESIEWTLSDDKSKITVKGINDKMAFNQTITITDNIVKVTHAIAVDWVDYDFYNDYGRARYYIGGSFVAVNASDFEDDSANNRIRIRVGTSRTSSLLGGKVRDGYYIGIPKDTGYEPGVKDPNNIVLVKLNSSGNDNGTVAITELEIVRRVIEPGRGPDDGQYWIRFKEADRDGWSYIVTWL